MGAAYSGKMATPNPERYGIAIEGVEGIQGYHLADIPMNRAMMAVRKHFDSRSDDFLATSFRLMCLMDFLRAFAKGNDSRREKYFQFENGEVDGVHDDLIRAAATAKLNGKGFDVESLLSIADALRPELSKADLHQWCCIDLSHSPRLPGSTGRDVQSVV